MGRARGPLSPPTITQWMPSSRIRPMFPEGLDDGFVPDVLNEVGASEDGTRKKADQLGARSTGSLEPSLGPWLNLPPGADALLPLSWSGTRQGLGRRGRAPRGRPAHCWCRDFW